MQSPTPTVHLGAILPLTGDRAAYGVSVRNGIELALDSLKGKGVVYEVSFEDSRGEARDAVSALEKLLASSQDSLPAIIGPVSSPEVLAVAPVAERRHVVILSPGASAPSISDAGDYIFRNAPSDIYEPDEMAKYAVGHMGLKTFAVLHVNNDYGIGVRDVFSATLSKLGAKLLLSEAYEVGVKDYRTALLKIKAAKPDAVYLAGYKEVGALLKQAKEMGLTSQFLSNSLFEDPDILTTAGDAADNVVFTTFPFDVTSQEPAMKKFVAGYKAKHGKDPDGFAAVGYDAMLLLDRAIKQTGALPGQVKQGLYGLREYHGPLGDISFDRNGDVVLPVKLKKCLNGAFVDL